jgi:glycosyltransferase involved in cell wall biosynthesis
MPTVVHVTHEAVHQVGGIGTVLRGMITARSYLARVERTILLGPLTDADSPEPLGPDGEVVYDSARGVSKVDEGIGLGRVAVQFGVRLVYGRRRLRGESGEAWPEVLLVDVSHPPVGLNGFKFHLSGSIGLDSRLYEMDWEYEQYLRLAEPGFEGVRALLGEASDPVWLIAHEFMGLGTVFKAMMDGDARFKTVFYAHEVATARLLVEGNPGRDVMFYNVLRLARARGGYVEDFFGPQDSFFKHALIRQAWRCDAVLAVGDRVVEELRFLGSEFADREIDLVYNGVPAAEIGMEAREASRRKLQAYAGRLLGEEPDLIFTHVTRLVRSKGLWRDLLVLEHLDRLLAAEGRRATFLVLATEGGRREPLAVQGMVDAYGWPLVHREGFPDLSDGELAFDLRVRAFNARARAVRAVFVNQFGWDAVSCGLTMPEDMGFADLRQGSDVEFGQSIYEPFGIALVEPLAFGAVCVVSDVCGCLGFVEQGAGGGMPDGLVRGDYTRLQEDLEIEDALEIGAEVCQRAEAEESKRVATALGGRLPGDGKQREAALKRGLAVAEGMSWECVVTDYFLPAMERM